MSVPDIVPDRTAPIKGTVRVPAAHVESLRSSFDALDTAMDQIMGLPGVRIALFQRLGDLHARVDHVARCLHEPDEVPLAIYSPPPDEPEPIGPTPEEMRWAAENLTPTSPPTTPEGVLRFLADALESVGIEAIAHAASLDFSMGDDYALDLRNLTDYFAAIEREYDERSEIVMPAPGDAILIDNGMPVG